MPAQGRGLLRAGPCAVRCAFCGLPPPQCHAALATAGSRALPHSAPTRHSATTPSPARLLVRGILGVKVQAQVLLHRLLELRGDAVGLRVLVQVGAALPEVARALVGLDLQGTQGRVGREEAQEGSGAAGAGQSGLPAASQRQRSAAASPAPCAG